MGWLLCWGFVTVEGSFGLKLVNTFEYLNTMYIVFGVIFGAILGAFVGAAILSKSVAITVASMFVASFGVAILYAYYWLTDFISGAINVDATEFAYITQDAQFTYIWHWLHLVFLLKFSRERSHDFRRDNFKID